MTAAREAFFLPLAFFTVALLGGLDPGAATRWSAPTLFSLVLAVMLVGALVRSGALAPERVLHPSRPVVGNANGGVLLVSLFAASAQLFHMLTPRSGLPSMIVGVLLLLLLVNTLVVSPDRVRLLRSLGVTIGSAFLLKFVVLTALVAPQGGRVKRVLLALFDAATFGAISQAPLAPSAGYIAFFCALLFLISVALLPSARTTAGDDLQLTTTAASASIVDASPTPSSDNARLTTSTDDFD
ncbi:MAG: hypothetical protein H0U19_09045 [Acidobacteria bacterium]|nr:hypothetical protein [Acidobacteriota bacterium]